MRSRATAGRAALQHFSTNLSMTGGPFTPNDENDMSVSQHLECNADTDAAAAHNE